MINYSKIKTVTTDQFSILFVEVIVHAKQTLIVKYQRKNTFD